MFTFTIPKLRPVVMDSEGQELIQRCLSAPDEEDEDGHDADNGAEQMDGGDDADSDDGKDGDDIFDAGDDDDGVDVTPSIDCRSPSKGSLAVIRPVPRWHSSCPSMTASGKMSKRSTSGTSGGGAACRRSRAATISNATVRQQKRQVNFFEQAVTGLNVPSRPATPSNGARNRKCRRTAVEGMPAPADLSASPMATAASTSAVTTKASAAASVMSSPAPA